MSPRKSGLGRGLKEMMAEEVPANPVISAVQFLSQTEQNGGASMSIHSLEPLSPGDRGYMVGGAPDKHNRPVKGEEYPADRMGVDDVLHDRRRMRNDLGGRGKGKNVYLGSWLNPEGTIDVDASNRYLTRSTAVKRAKERGERAVWDNQKAQEIFVSPPKWTGNPGSWRDKSFFKDRRKHDPDARWRRLSDEQRSQESADIRSRTTAQTFENLQNLYKKGRS